MTPYKHTLCMLCMLECLINRRTVLYYEINDYTLNTYLGTNQNSSVINSINNQIDCGSPTVLKGARILTDSYSTTEAAQVTLICTEGLFSNYTITCICTREGTWNPDPAKFSCLPETSGMASCM